MYYTGVALINPNDATARATIALYTDSGTLLESTAVTLQAKQRITKLLDEILPSIAGQSISSGYVRVTSDRGLAGFSVFGTWDFKTLSAVPPQVIR
jgi:hypothetical protein